SHGVQAASEDTAGGKEKEISRSHARVAQRPVKNRPETGRPPRRSFSTPAGWFFARAKHAHSVGFAFPKTTVGSFRQNAPPAPALMLRSIAARREHRCFHTRTALRCVSKHEGTRPSPVLILQDARTRVRVRGNTSVCALLRMRTSIAFQPSSRCQTVASGPRFRLLRRPPSYNGGQLPSAPCSELLAARS